MADASVEPLKDVLPDEQDGSAARMWPLDVALAVLGGLVIYTIATRLSPDDPRLVYNPWTYAVSVPLVVVALSMLLRNVASRFVRRSLQLGFLLSVMVHLLLLITFFNVMIFAPFWPSATSGDQPIRAPLRKTVPDYLFARSDLPQKQPDWSRPVDAATASRTIPDQQRRLPPLEATDQLLEMPHERPPEETSERPNLTPRRLDSSAVPTPSSSAAELSRQSLRRAPSVDSSIEVPDVPAPISPSAGAVERSLEVASSPASLAESRLDDSGLRSAQLPEFAPQAAAQPPRIERRADSGLPRVGELAVDTARQSRRAPEAEAAPAGAVPAAPTVRVARESAAADRVLSDRASLLTTPRSSAGATLTPADTSGASVAQIDQSGSLTAPLARSERAVAGMPEVAVDARAMSAPPREGRVRHLRELPPGSLGAPDISDLRAARGPADGSAAGAADRVPAAAADRALALDASGRDSGRTAGDAAGVDIGRLGLPAPATVDLNAPLGPAGLSADPARRIGSTLAEQVPEVASVDIGRPTDRRRDSGGRPAPAGGEIAGTRPFDRRTMRTSGGAAPTPAGVVGPEVETAIERGLAYLAERQNADGSWSLQGHGEDVMMRSDTAATGLTLLAFQGAGYTHKQHQYADTVARGLEFLVAHQQSTGDLYRSEDAASNRNAWLYSHGIAALALCEAYGMTRDEALRAPAQRSIDFIAFSQDPRVGGWRYQPQVGSDTSVTGWMMMALKSGELSGLNVPEGTYEGIERWMDVAQEGPDMAARYRYNPYAPNTVEQRHGRRVTATMTAVGLLARLYLGWERSNEEMQRGADYLAKFPPMLGTPRDPQRDTYYWYYATQVMFHMGGKHWKQWNDRLSPLLVTSQVDVGPNTGSWDPERPLPDRWAPHAGRLYVTTMNLLSLEVYYRHLPIYVETGK